MFALHVKNSGHYYKGRNSAPNSLALWTHNVQPAIKSEKNFIPDGYLRLWETALCSVLARASLVSMNSRIRTTSRLLEDHLPLSWLQAVGYLALATVLWAIT